MVHAFAMVSAVVPSLLLLWYFHSRDTFPEPGRIVWKTFAFGALAILPVLVVALPVSFVVQALGAPPPAVGFLKAFFTAAIPEEAFKFLVLYAYVRKLSEFDEPMDGLVYGVAASLGFATLENILYCSQGGPGLAVMRALTAVPVHAGCGAVMGYYFGRAHFEPSRRAALYLRAFLFPMLLHGLYDWPILTLAAASTEGRQPPAPIVFLYVLTALVLVGIIVIWAIRIGLRARREQEERGIPMPQLAPVPAPPEPATILPGPKPESVRSIAGGVLLLLMGGLFASVGGFFLLGFLLLSVQGPMPAGGLGPFLLAVALVGVLPLFLGLIFFRKGIRRLNRPRAA